MNDSAPNTTGLQIAIILSALLALILGVTAYTLYRENLELKQQLEKRGTPAAVSLLSSHSDAHLLPTV